MRSSKPSTFVTAAASSILVTATMMACLASPSSVLAQDTDDLTVVLRGLVMDELSGQPLHGAFVTPTGSDTGYLTDSTGVFLLKVARSNSAYALSAEQLGYVSAQFSVSTADAEGMIELRLVPDPVVLQGLHVLTDRFQSRRRAVATPVRSFDRGDLLRASSFDVADHLRYHSGIFVTACRGTRLCVRSRGRVVQPRIYIDEMPVYGGLDQLALYAPQDLYLLEVYGNGRMIRAYTEGFMTRYAKQGGRLFPIPLFWQ